MSVETTTAVVATAFGGPEVLELRELPLAPPGPDEVVVEVRAAGTNPIDYKQYSGAMGRPELPLRLGREASGVVVGSGAEVIAYPANGTYATHVVVPASSWSEARERGPRPTHWPSSRPQPARPSCCTAPPAGSGCSRSSSRCCAVPG